VNLTREYNNKNLERKRRKLLLSEQGVATLRAMKPRQGNVRDAIENAFNTAVNATAHGLTTEIGAAVLSLSPCNRAAFQNLLMIVEKESSLLDAHKEFLKPLARLASWSSFWVTNVSEWRAKSYNNRRCFSSLARHLLARYDVPLFMDEAWLGSTVNQQMSSWQEWFIHIGQGQNIRKASNLPVRFTKMQAHHFLQAPKDYTINEAIRWGQIRGLGGEERLVEAVIATHMGRSFHRDETFWATVLQWFVNHQTMDMRQVGPVIDYIDNVRHRDRPSIWMNGGWRYQGPEQPDFSVKGRTAESLVRLTEEWHKQLAKTKTRKITKWESCGIAGLDTADDDGRNRVVIRELLTSNELQQEGRAMHHCVGSYSWNCSSGKCAIYSMRVEDAAGNMRGLTIEVDVHSRAIVQVRGKYNVSPNPADTRILRSWATREHLKVGRWAI
jgi:hypothetical protein